MSQLVAGIILLWKLRIDLIQPRLLSSPNGCTLYTAVYNLCTVCPKVVFLVTQLAVYMLKHYCENIIFVLFTELFTDYEIDTKIMFIISSPCHQRNRKCKC